MRIPLKDGGDAYVQHSSFMGRDNYGVWLGADDGNVGEYVCGGSCYGDEHAAGLAYEDLRRLGWV